MSLTIDTVARSIEGSVQGSTADGGIPGDAGANAVTGVVFALGGLGNAQDWEIDYDDIVCDWQ